MSERRQGYGARLFDEHSERASENDIYTNAENFCYGDQRLNVSAIAVVGVTRNTKLTSRNVDARRRILSSLGRSLSPIKPIISRYRGSNLAAKYAGTFRFPDRAFPRLVTECRSSCTHARVLLPSLEFCHKFNIPFEH